MEQERLRAILESLLFVAGEPVSLVRLAAVMEGVSRQEIRAALSELSLAYHRDGRGIVLEEVAGGYQLRTPRDHALYVRRLLSAKPPRLTRPLLETLAIIAYRQPITRPEIDQLRGVDSGGVIETLLERKLVRIAGRKEAPGRPLMYATTAEFLTVFGLKDLDSLPDLGELREVERRLEAAEQQVEAGVGQDSEAPQQLPFERLADPPLQSPQPAPSSSPEPAQSPDFNTAQEAPPESASTPAVASDNPPSAETPSEEKGNEPRS